MFGMPCSKPACLGQFLNRAMHPHKEIRKSISYAEAKGWRVLKAGPRAHLWGKLLCGFKDRNGCVVRVSSTPKNAEAHAREIRRRVDGCPHSW